MCIGGRKRKHTEQPQTLTHNIIIEVKFTLEQATKA